MPLPPTHINEIRSRYIEFFERHGHRFVPSANLVPENDDTLLFTNAGMVQFKDALMGLEQRPYRRAVTSQRCLRVSGKHNDLEEVGISPRHHTFFEMLGNFSFGDYFKEQAIKFAWQLLVEEWDLPLERLWFSIYEDDDEAAQLWRDVGVDSSRILKFGRKDNWWSMGETGPCGPCSEIHYYWGDPKDEHPDGVNRDDEYLEFWNLVFMQFDQVTPQDLEPLPNPGVDTGAGLERVASILQGCTSNYDTDGFLYLMDRVQQLADHTDLQRQEHLVAYRVIADHARATTFLISDGVLPGNEGRNYITRLLLRRAARFGRTLGFLEPFMAQVVEGVVNGMGDHFQEIRQREDMICSTVTAEETRFLQTLNLGLGQLEGIVRENKKQGLQAVSGAQSFLLWDTFGFPLDLTRDLAREEGMTVDLDEFQALAAQARARSRQATESPTAVRTPLYGDILRRLQKAGQLDNDGVKQTIFNNVHCTQTAILALVQEGMEVTEVGPGMSVEVVVAATPFYVAAGGQVSDSGQIWVEGDDCGQMMVTDAYRPVPGLIVHSGTITDGLLKVGSPVKCAFDESRRQSIQRNHTATHLLHACLRNHLGLSVHQAGSMVAPERLRFDFTLDRGMTEVEVAKVQADLQTAILADSPVTTSWEPYADAVASGAMALFGEKYEEMVRVVRIGGETAVSLELCGGLHVNSTAELGSIFIMSEGSSAAGQRRIEAVTGAAANRYVGEAFARLNKVATILKTQPDMVEQSLTSLLELNALLRKELQQGQRAQVKDHINKLVEEAQEFGGVPCVLKTVQAQGLEMMREMSDLIQDQLGESVVALAADIKGKPMLVVSVAKSLAHRGLHAGNLVQRAAPCIGGGGGGRQNIAQAGGKDVAGLSAALCEVANTITDQLIPAN